jgi:uncharacterized repeat protein (TIGR03833 family)
MREVVPGASVNIVLKADQPTGRTVQGIIGSVLTRANHPRGIKVRLTDGRVGRVQTMASDAAPAPSTAQPGRSNNLDEATIHNGSWQHGAVLDIRYSEHQDAPPQQIGLDAYIKEKQPKKRGRGKVHSTHDATSAENELPADGSAASSQPPSASATCPVCREFEGDEVAVAHHVSSHFDDEAAS